MKQSKLPVVEQRLRLVAVVDYGLSMMVVSEVAQPNHYDPEIDYPIHVLTDRLDHLKVIQNISWN